MTKTSILAVLGATATAVAAIVLVNAVPASAEPQDKIVICHIDQDDLEPTAVVISVSANSWTAHEAHGDYVTDLLVGSPCEAAPVI